MFHELETIVVGPMIRKVSYPNFSTGHVFGKAAVFLYLSQPLAVSSRRRNIFIIWESASETFAILFNNILWRTAFGAESQLSILLSRR